MDNGVDSNLKSSAVYLFADDTEVVYACVQPDEEHVYGRAEVQSLDRDPILNDKVAHNTPDLAFVNPYFVLYPAEKWDKEQAMAAMRQMLSDPDAYILKSEPSEIMAGIHGVFAVKQSLLETFYRWHLGLKLHHIVPLYLRRLGQLPDFNTMSAVFLHLLDGKVLVASVREGKLILANIYKLTNKADLLYFVLAQYSEAGLDPEKDPLYYSGLMEKGGSYYSSIFDYVRNIEKAPFATDQIAGDEYSSIFSMFDLTV